MREINITNMLKYWLYNIKQVKLTLHYQAEPVKAAMHASYTFRFSHMKKLISDFLQFNA